MKPVPLSAVDGVKGVVLGIGALISALPGIVPLYLNLGVPPSEETLFRNFVLGCIFVEVVLILAIGGAVADMSVRRFLMVGLGGVAFSATILLVHIALLDWTVIRDQQQECAECPTKDVEVYLPLWTNGDLAKLIDTVHGRHAIYSQYQTPDILRKTEGHTWAFFVTNAVILLTFLMTVVPISGVMLLGVLRFLLQQPSPPAGQVQQSQGRQPPSC